MKTKNNTFLTFLDKMQFSEILCLATYDWFCADGSHIVRGGPRPQTVRRDVQTL